ncbi:hypothetical protein [Ekhidna sp.]|uniref:hypothetical protein n=1 Tax=Ekhidna sp. TaxID=2608089 RepID=UPI003CCBD179
MKLKLLPILGLFVAAAMTSCGGDDEPTAAAPSVTVSASVDGDALASGEDVTVGSAVQFDISITAPGGVNGLNVTSGTQTTSFSRSDLEAEAGDTQASITLETDLAVEADIGGTVSFTFEAVDDLNQTATATFTYMIIAAPSPDVSSYTAILLGAQGNSEEGFYDAQTNTRYTYAGARDASGVNSSPIDFAYYYGNTNENSIAAIDDDGLNAVYTSVGLAIEGNFGTRNSTRFVSSTMSAEDFDAISTNAELEEAAAFEVNGNSSATQLVVDQVVAFQFDEDRGGDFGLIRISSIDDTNGNGTITIEVKVPGEESAN